MLKICRKQTHNNTVEPSISTFHSHLFSMVVKTNDSSHWCVLTLVSMPLQATNYLLCIYYLEASKSGYQYSLNVNGNAVSVNRSRISGSRVVMNNKYIHQLLPKNDKVCIHWISWPSGIRNITVIIMITMHNVFQWKTNNYIILIWN